MRKLHWVLNGLPLFPLGPQLTLLTSFQAPWLSPRNIHRVLEILQQNPSLEDLSLYGTGHWEPIFKESELFVTVGRLQQLKRLVMQRIRPVRGGLEYLLNRLPNLMTLETGLWGCPQSPLSFSPTSSSSSSTIPVDHVKSAQKNSEAAVISLKGPLSLKKLCLSDVFLEISSIRLILPVIEASPLLESLSMEDNTGRFNGGDPLATEALSNALYPAGSSSCPLRELCLRRIMMKDDQLQHFLSYTANPVHGSSPSSSLSTTYLWHPLTTLNLEDTIVDSEEIFDVILTGSPTLKDTLEALKISHIHPAWRSRASVRIAWVLQHFVKLRELVLKQGIVILQDLLETSLTPPVEGVPPLDKVCSRETHDPPGQLLQYSLCWIPWACHDTLEVLDIKIEGPDRDWCPSEVISYYNDDYYIFPINHHGTSFDQYALETLEKTHPLYMGALRELNSKPRLNWGESKFTC